MDAEWEWLIEESRQMLTRAIVAATLLNKGIYLIYIKLFSQC